MAIFYVRSTDGNDANNGSTWALAKATLAGAASASAAGDTIYVSQAHAETQASAMTITLPGTIASPSYVICANDSAEPPTAVATTATVSTTGASNLDIKGHCYVYGISFSAGNSTSAANIRLAQGDTRSNQLYESCNFICAGNSASGTLAIPASGSSHVMLRNCGLKFAHTSQTLNVAGALSVDGGSLMPGTAAQGYLLLDNATTPMRVEFSGFDFSNGPTGIDLIRGNNGAQQGTIVFRDCRQPASWSGTLFNVSPTVAGTRGEMYNTDSGDTNYRIWIEDAYAALVQDTSVYNDAGAMDGTTRLSWKIASTSRCNFGSGRFPSPEIVRWNETTGSAITATVEIVHDGASAATDGEIWLEVMYLGTSGVPLGAWISDAKADILASATAQATSSATWTGDTGTGPNGSSTWNTLKLACAFTPQEKGFLHARVVVAKASWTVYVDPLLTVT